MAKKLRIGILGLGGIARLHMPGWLASEHVEVVAGCDISEIALDLWKQEYGTKNLHTEPEAIINDPNIDVIDVCTPNAYHSAMAIAAMEAGKDVLCEKPLAPTTAEIEDMIAARDRTGRTLMTAHHFRFMNTSQALKTEIDAGALGPVYHARSWMLRRSGLPVRPGFIYRQYSGGGATLDIGVHILDLTLWLMGNPEPISVSGVSRIELARQEGAFSRWGDIPSDVDVEEFAAAFVRFDTGATLMLEIAWMLNHNTDREDAQIWLYGPQAGCHWPSCEFYETNNRTRLHANRSLRVGPDVIEARARGCMAFAQLIVDGAPSLIPAEQSLQVARILEGIYRSQETGSEVRLN
jgi:predicted dehydrogenase